MCGNEIYYLLFFIAFAVTNAVLLKLIWKKYRKKPLSSENDNDKKDHTIE